MLKLTYLGTSAITAIFCEWFNYFTFQPLYLHQHITNTHRYNIYQLLWWTSMFSLPVLSGAIFIIVSKRYDTNPQKDQHHLCSNVHHHSPMGCHPLTVPEQNLWFQVAQMFSGLGVLPVTNSVKAMKEATDLTSLLQYKVLMLVNNLQTDSVIAYYQISHSKVLWWCDLPPFLPFHHRFFGSDTPTHTNFTGAS